MTPVMSRPLAAFKNEAVLDFKRPEDVSAAQAALKRVRAELGREYELWIAGAAHKTGRSADQHQSREAIGGRRQASSRHGGAGHAGD